MTISAGIFSVNNHRTKSLKFDQSDRFIQVWISKLTEYNSLRAYKYEKRISVWRVNSRKYYCKLILIDFINFVAYWWH